MRLNAWVDGELPDEQTVRVGRHLEACRSCAREAEALRTLSTALNDMPAFRTPARLARKTMRKFRAELEAPGIIEWWRSLGFVMRSATCSAMIAGLLFGVGIGRCLTILQASAASNGFINMLYPTGGILP
jgi:anti-sigma factor RsiW